MGLTDERIKEALVAGDYTVVSGKVGHRKIFFTRQQASMFGINDRDVLIIDDKRIIVDVEGLWEV